MLTPHGKVTEQGLQCSQQGLVGGACKQSDQSGGLGLLCDKWAGITV